MKAVAVIPAYNEALRITAVIQGVKKYLPDVIVVADGGTDGTAEVARAAGARVVEHAINSGAGAATMTGLTAARQLGFDAAVTIDADGQHSPDDIPRLLEALNAEHADLVIANRFGRKNNIPFIRRFLNGAGNVVTFLVTGLYLPDTQCGFKAFGPKALKEVNLKMSGFEFCTEIVREARVHRWKVVSVPSKVVYSEYTLAKGQSAANGLKVAAKILLRSLLR